MIEAGLPNVLGSYKCCAMGENKSANVDGAFTEVKPESTVGLARDGSTTAGYAYGFTFSAKNSNSIYGNSITVQPTALTTTYIIKY